VKVAASDGGAGVARTQVRFCQRTSCVFAKGSAIGTDATAPYAITWSNLPVNGTYTLIAQAIDRVGNRQWSAPVTVKVVNSTTAASARTSAPATTARSASDSPVISDRPVPTAPSDLAATREGATVVLRWSDRVANEAGHRVEWRTANGAAGATPWQPLKATPPANATTVRVRGPEPGTTAEYRIVAVNGESRSVPSNAATAPKD
jgi:hypothetical protein